MAGKKVTVMVGFIPLRTRIEVAVDEEASNTRTICTGLPEGSHEPSRVKMHVDCQVCDRSHSSVFAYSERGVEHGDKLVVLSRDEIAKAKGVPVTGRDGKPLPQLAWKRRADVYAATVAGDSVQNIYPDKGSEAAYTLVRDALRAKPDVVGVMIWAPTTANSLWVVEVVGDRLVASKRSWPEYVRNPQEIPAAEPSEAERVMMSQYIEGSVTDFDLTEYVDQSRKGMEELIAAQAESGVPLASTGAASIAAIPDMLAALQANLEAAGVKPVKVAPKKAAAKKAPAKKAPAKRAARKPKEVAA